MTRPALRFCGRFAVRRETALQNCVKTLFMTTSAFELNQRAADLCGDISESSDSLRIARSSAECGTTLLDFGIDTPGSVEAGLLLARVCLADLATVTLVDADPKLGPWPLLEVVTGLR